MKQAKCVMMTTGAQTMVLVLLRCSNSSTRVGARVVAAHAVAHGLAPNICRPLHVRGLARHGLTPGGARACAAGAARNLRMNRAPGSPASDIFSLYNVDDNKGNEAVDAGTASAAEPKSRRNIRRQRRIGRRAGGSIRTHGR